MPVTDQRSLEDLIVLCFTSHERIIPD
jgi:hypothetical protein